MSGVSIVVVIVTLLIGLALNKSNKIKILNRFIKSKNLVLNHIIY